MGFCIRFFSANFRDAVSSTSQTNSPRAIGSQATWPGCRHHSPPSKYAGAGWLNFCRWPGRWLHTLNIKPAAFLSFTQSGSARCACLLSLSAITIKYTNSLDSIGSSRKRNRKVIFHHSACSFPRSQRLLQADRGRVGCVLQ